MGCLLYTSQRAELMLADGTKVWLNSRSTLTFPGRFKGDIRTVKLVGEGYFAVTKNFEQPFIVETNKCNVKLLGLSLIHIWVKRILVHFYFQLFRLYICTVNVPPSYTGRCV